MSNVEIFISTNQGAAESITKALDDFERQHGENPERMAPKEAGVNPMGVYAYDRGQLLGGITFYEHNDWIFLLCGFVLPEWRRLGLYRKMIEHLEMRARAAGRSGIFVSTYDFEAPAVYEALGFTRGAVLHNCPRGNTSIDYFKEV